MDKKQSIMEILSDRDILSLFKKLILLIVVFNIIAVRMGYKWNVGD